MRIADRLSINLEAPNDPPIGRLSPRTSCSLEELLRPLQWVDEIRRTQIAALGLERPVAVRCHPVRRRRSG